MDEFNQIDTQSKETDQLESGLFLLDPEESRGSIRSEVVPENLIRLGARSKYVRIIRQWAARSEIVAL